MFAIRCRRFAAGCHVEGEYFAHNEWTLKDALSDAEKAAGEVQQGHTQPLLEVYECAGPSDPMLKPWPVKKSDDAPADGGSDVDGYSQLKRADLVTLAGKLGIQNAQTTKSADLVKAVREATSSDSSTERMTPPTATTNGTVIDIWKTPLSTLVTGLSKDCDVDRTDKAAVIDRSLKAAGYKFDSSGNSTEGPQQSATPLSDGTPSTNGADAAKQTADALALSEAQAKADAVKSEPQNSDNAKQAAAASAANSAQTGK